MHTPAITIANANSISAPLTVILRAADALVEQLEGKCYVGRLSLLDPLSVTLPALLVDVILRLHFLRRLETAALGGVEEDFLKLGVLLDFHGSPLSE